MKNISLLDFYCKKNPNSKQLFRIMRTSIFLLLFCSFSLMAKNANSQNAKVTINKQDVRLESILSEIESQTNYLFIYKKNVDVNLHKSISVKARPVSEVLSILLHESPIIYKIEGNHIILTKKEITQTPTIKKITGVVTDRAGEPLIGVTITVKGISQGSITDINGKFSLSADIGDVLQFSYIGYIPQTIKLKNLNSLKVFLVEDVKTLDEVVVVGYGSQKRTNLTGAISTVTSQELVDRPASSVTHMLQGRVPGLNITTSSGVPGNTASFNIRGTNSINGGSPLVLVDGVEGDLDRVNPNDIESISVLSGSAAAALYGSAAANGVVLITTKKGAVDKTRLTYSNNSTFYSPFRLPEFQNTYGSETGEWYSWASKLSSPTDYEVKDFFQTGYNVANTVSLTTGTQKNQTYVSVGAVNARGIIQNNDLDRYNFSVRNTTSMLNDKLTMDLSFMYSNVKEQNMLSQGEYANPLVPVYLFPRGDDFSKYQYYERYDVDRNIKTQFWPLKENGLSMQNPYWITNRNMYTNKKDRFLASGSLKYTITDWLNVSGRVKLDKETINSEKKMYASTLNVIAENSDKGAYVQSNKNTSQIYADAMLNINKYFYHDTWNLTASLGASLLDLDYKELNFGGGLLTIPNLFTSNNANVSGKLTYKNTNYHDRTNSLFGTFSLGYKGMVYVDGSLRNDWISALAGTNHSSILYPSIGASAILTNMFTMKSNILSYAKVRLSYSEVGNAPERFRAITTYAVLGGLNTTSYFPIKDLKPERTHSWEGGFNLGLFDNKLTLDVTAYKTYTENQLFSPEISTTTGYSKLYVNAGKVTNKGIELALGFKQNIGPVDWKTTLLWSLNRNRIDQLLPEYTNEELGVTVHLDEMDVYSLGGAKQRLTVGGSMGDVYVNTMRTDEHGYIWMNSMTGALETDKNNYVYAGNTNPKYTLSWRNEFNWKGISLGFMLNARVGGIGVSATQAVMDYYGVSKTSAEARDNGGVKVNGQMIDAQTWYQTIGANGTGYVGSMYVYSMTNVRLGELTLGYDIPINKWCKWISGLNVSFVGRNLWMLYCKAPFDPESTASTGTYNQGMDYFMQPSLRSMGFSAKISF